MAWCDVLQRITVGIHGLQNKPPVLTERVQHLKHGTGVLCDRLKRYIYVQAKGQRGELQSHPKLGDSQ